MMKKIISAFFIIVSILFISKTIFADTLFSDSFSGTTIDTTKWTEYDSAAGGSGGTAGKVQQNNALTFFGDAINWSTNGVMSKATYNRSAGLSIQAEFSTTAVNPVSSNASLAIPLGFGNDLNISSASADNLYIKVDLFTNRFSIIRGGANGTAPSSKAPTFALVPGDRYRVIIVPGTTSGATFQLYDLTSDPSATTDLLVASSMNTVTGGTFTSGYVFATAKSSIVTTTLYSVSVTSSTTIAGAPTNFIATPQSTQVPLSWTAPVSNGGTTITDYLVEYKLSSSGTWLTFSHAASTATSITVTGLTNNSSYDFRVSAVNAIGAGTASAIATTTPVLGVPSVPLNLIAANSTSGQVDLSWTTPSSTGASAITDYLIEYKTSASATWLTFSDGVSTTTAANVTGLTNGTSYNFRVSAINGQGTGDPSSTVTRNAVSMVATAPQASNVSISGSAYVSEVLVGSYTYLDVNADAEGASTFRWLSSSTSNGTYTPISGATSTSYTVTSADLNKYIKFEVTPVTNVTPTTGTAVTSASFGPIGTASYIYHILSTGQSLSLGYNGTPALSTTQPYNNKMLDGANAFTPLVESSFESPASAMANGITALVGDPNYQIAVTKHGVGNTEYAGLMKGTTPYSTGMSQVSSVIADASALGKISRVLAVTSIHGERDHVLGTSALTYEADLVQWQSDYQTDVQALTGQHNTIPLFTDQVSSFTGYNSATSVIPEAQLSAAENNVGKIYLVAPKYFLNYADFAHLTNASYRWLGEYYAKVMKKVLIDNIAWRPLSTDTITRSGNIIYAKFHVPAGVLAFDTTSVLAQTNYGFEYSDSTNSASISSVEIISSDTVKVTLSTTPTGSSQKLRYAYTGVAGSNPGAQVSGSARGNLRDTDTATSLSGNTLYDWAVQFNKAISVDSTAPSALSYTGTPFSFTKNSAISAVSPTVTGNVNTFSVSPSLPTGLSINASTGIISGTPTTTSTATNYTVTATNASGSTNTIISIAVNESAPSALSYTGTPFSFTKNVLISSLTPTVTGTVTSYSISPALPAGLSLNTSSGVISGTPTVLSSSTNYTVTATNVAGSTNATISITIVDSAPTGLSYPSNSYSFNRNSVISSLTPTVTGTVTSYSISPALPAGLSLNTSSGVISGTPTVTTATASYTVTATNTAGSTTFIVSITIAEIPPSALSYTGTPFSFTKNNAISAVSPTVSGVVTGYSVSPALPTGLSLNTSSGVISGTPTVTSGSTVYTITASNTVGSTNTTISITVIEPAPSALSYTGTPFSFTKNVLISSLTPAVTGTVTSYSVSPALPAGLSLNTSSGVISGTPTIATSSTSYTVTATNSTGNTTTTISITVIEPAPSSLQYPSSSYSFTRNVAITNIAPTVSGLVSDYAISPALPTGLSFDTSNGVISGTPTIVSNATTYTVTASNATGSTTFNFSLAVAQAAPSALSYAGSPFAYNKNSTVSPAYPTVTGVVGSYGISPSLPTGLSIDSNTGVISGTPTVTSTTASYTVTATNAVGSTTASITITIGDEIVVAIRSSGGGGGLINIVQPKTQPTLPIISNQSATNANSKTPNTNTFTRQMSLGDVGQDVKALQILLNKNGFTIAKQGPGSIGHETSTFGPSTKNAIKKLQKKYKIPTTGTIGPLTLEVIKKLKNK